MTQRAFLSVETSLTGRRWLGPNAEAERLAEAMAQITRLPLELCATLVTRGVAPRDHVMPVGIAPTVFMMSNPMKPPSAEQRHHGVACVTARDFRWERGDIKSTSLLGNVLARRLPSRRARALGRVVAMAAGIGAAVEAFSYAERNPRSAVGRAIHASGHAIQAGFVTREPNEEQLAVGRAAMEEILRAEHAMEVVA